MTTSDPTSHYALGSTDAEHERLIRQAAHLAPLTEPLFREAGIGPVNVSSILGEIHENETAHCCVERFVANNLVHIGLREVRIAQASLGHTCPGPGDRVPVAFYPFRPRGHQHGHVSDA